MKVCSFLFFGVVSVVTVNTLVAKYLLVEVDGISEHKIEGITKYNENINPFCTPDQYTFLFENQNRYVRTSLIIAKDILMNVDFGRIHWIALQLVALIAIAPSLKINYQDVT